MRIDFFAALVTIVILSAGYALVYVPNAPINLPEIIAQVKIVLESVNPFGTVTAIYLIEHPEKYLNKSITVIGGISSNWDTTYKYTLVAKNEEGRSVSIPLKYETFYCLRCKITGIVKTYDVCTCQKRTVMSNSPIYPSIEDMPWKIYDPIVNVLHVNRCERKPEELNFGFQYEKTEYRCEPNTKRDVYYIDAVKVKSLD